jgi:hypothetical protein
MAESMTEGCVDDWIDGKTRSGLRLNGKPEARGGAFMVAGFIHANLYPVLHPAIDSVLCHRFSPLLAKPSAIPGVS